MKIQNKILQVSILILLFVPVAGEAGLLWILFKIWQGHFLRVFNNKVNQGLGIFSIWLIINSCFAYQPSEAFLGLANFLPFFALFSALNILINHPSQLRTIAWLLVIPSFPVVILGLGQLYGNWGSPQLIANLLGWTLTPQGVPEGRMSSVFIYANFLAVYLAIAFILTLGLLFDIWQQQRNSRRNWLISLLGTILIFNCIGLSLTSSRNAWVIAFLSLIIFAIYFSWNWLLWGVTVLGIMIVGASFGSFWGQQWLRKVVPMFIWGRLSDNLYPDRPLETLRITQWQFCWSKIQERPVIGWGLRNYTPLYLDATNFWFGHPHNLFLMLGMETGIIATLFLCLIVGNILFQAIMLLRRTSSFNQRDRLIFFTYLIACGSIICFNLFDVTIFDLRVNTISWILLAAVSGVSQQSHQQLKHF